VLTEHFSGKRLDFQVLQMLVGSPMKEADSGVETNRKPNADANVEHLTDLAVPAWVRNEDMLKLKLFVILSLFDSLSVKV
jgi:hypothetical protein